MTNKHRLGLALLVAAAVPCSALHARPPVRLALWRTGSRGLSASLEPADGRRSSKCTPVAPLARTYPPTPTLRECFAFAIPTLGVYAAPMLMSLIDAGFVGRASTLELAALGPAGAISDSIPFFFLFLSIAATNLVARSNAAGDTEGTRRIARTALWLGGASASLLSALTVRVRPFTRATRRAPSPPSPLPHRGRYSAPYLSRASTARVARRRSSRRSARGASRSNVKLIKLSNITQWRYFGPCDEVRRDPRARAARGRGRRDRAGSLRRDQGRTHAARRSCGRGRIKHGRRPAARLAARPRPRWRRVGDGRVAALRGRAAAARAAEEGHPRRRSAVMRRARCRARYRARRCGVAADDARDHLRAALVRPVPLRHDHQGRRAQRVRRDGRVARRRGGGGAHGAHGGRVALLRALP